MKLKVELFLFMLLCVINSFAQVEKPDEVRSGENVLKFPGVTIQKGRDSVEKQKKLYRINLSIWGDQRYLKVLNNLSDLPSPSSARANIGLGNVDNTSDLNKPISTPTQTALNQKFGVGNFISNAPLEIQSTGSGNSIQYYLSILKSGYSSDGYLSSSDYYDFKNKISKDSLGISFNSSNGNLFLTGISNSPTINLSSWGDLRYQYKLPVSTESGFLGVIPLGLGGGVYEQGYQWTPYSQMKNIIGLGSVDNTSDLNKPISTSTQLALNEKAGINTNNNFTGSNLFISPIFSNSTSTSSFSSLTGEWVGSGNLATFRWRYNTKVGSNTVTWYPLNIDTNGWVGIGMVPTQSFEVAGLAKFNSDITATSINASGSILANTLRLRRQTNIATPSVGVSIGNIAGNLVVKDSLGNVRNVPYIETQNTWSTVNNFPAGIGIGTNNVGIRKLYVVGDAESTTKFVSPNITTDIITPYSGSDLIIRGANTDAVRIFGSTRNVVIQNGGTFIDSGERLQVNGTGRFSGTLNLSSSTTIPLNVDGDVSYTQFRTGAGVVKQYITSANDWQFINSTSIGATFFSTNGVERLRIASNGNVGIGTNSPSYLLDVNGTSAFRGSTSFLSGADITNPPSGNGLHISFATGTNRSVINSVNAGVTGRELALGGFPLTFYNSQTGTEIARFHRNGSLGIGTAAPTHTLTLANTSTGISYYNTSDQVTNFERVRHYWNSNTYFIAPEAGGTGTLRSISIGKLGVGGVNNTSRTLHVTGDIESNTNILAPTLTTNDIRTYSGGDFELRNGSTNSLRMKLFGSTGNLVLQNGGTFTDAGYRLDNVGSTRLDGSTISLSGSKVGIDNGASPWALRLNTTGIYTYGQSINIAAGTTGDNSTTSINFSTTTAGTNSTKMTILANGNLGIGTTNPNAVFDAVIGSTGEGRFSRSSTQWIAFNSDAASHRITSRSEVGAEKELWISNVTSGGVSTPSTAIKFVLNSNIPLSLFHNGNVGVGTGNTLATEKLEVNGNIKTKHIIGQYDKNTSSTVSGVTTAILGDDLGGSITLTTSSTRLSGDVVTVTFTNAYGTAPFIQLTDANDNYAMGLTNPVKVSSTTTSFTLTVKTGLSLEPNQIYKWNYSVKQ